jgi:hypothetical protein
LQAWHFWLLWMTMLEFQPTTSMALGQPDFLHDSGGHQHASQSETSFVCL